MNELKEKRKYNIQSKYNKEEIKCFRKKLLIHKFCKNIREKIAELTEVLINEIEQLDESEK